MELSSRVLESPNDGYAKKKVTKLGMLCHAVLPSEEYSMVKGVWSLLTDLFINSMDNISQDCFDRHIFVHTVMCFDRLHKLPSTCNILIHLARM